MGGPVEQESPRSASSGTNAHVILEEAHARRIPVRRLRRAL